MATGHRFMQMNAHTRMIVAEHVYEHLRGMSHFLNPNMRPWQDLSDDEREEVAKGMGMWLLGIGCNEVLAEWYNRDGSIPKVMWEEIAPYTGPEIFGSPALHMLDKLIELANKANPE